MQRGLLSITVLCLLSACAGSVPLSLGKKGNMEKQNLYFANHKVRKVLNKADTLQQQTHTVLMVREYIRLFEVPDIEDCFAKATFRLLWIRAFQEPVCIQVEEYDQRVNILLRVYNKEVYDPIHRKTVFDHIITDTSFTIAFQEWKNLSSKMNAISFWQMEPTSYRVLGCADGSTWILEGKTEEMPYHYVVRKCPGKEDLAFERCCMYFLELAQHKVRKSEIY